VYLLDTNVLSDLSPGRSVGGTSLIDWLRRNGDLCYLSVVRLTEIAYGVAWLRHRGATAKATRLGNWLEEVFQAHEGRIIPVGHDIALQAGVLMAVMRAAGAEPDLADALIAATGKVHGMEVLTFNEADFRPMQVACRNPVIDPPPDRAS
jgi:predicted nucleic acid-binding protein